MAGYMRVMDAMTKTPVFVEVNTSLEECARLMLKEKVGSLVIQENNVLKGIVTEKDFVQKAFLKRLDPKKTSVSEIMSTIIVTVDPEADIMDAVKLMIKHEIRRLPAVDKENSLFGLITMNDILRLQPQLFELIVDKSRLFSSRKSFIDSTCVECKDYSLVRSVNGRFLCQECERNERVINYLR